jgi:hypothetical protein
LAAPPSSPPADHIAQCLRGRPDPQKTGRKTMADLRAAAEACQKARAALMEKTAVRAIAPSTEPQVEVAAAEAVKAREDLVDAELPAFPLGQSNWSLTLQAFLGLTRVTFGSRSSGTVDQFAPLSGVGTGLKIRYSYVDAKDKVRELAGLSAGLYYEPKVPVSGAAGSDTAQTLSAMLTLSTFEYIYLGVGLKFASSEPAFDRGFHTHNFMLVFGLGADGKTLTN